MSNPPGDPLPLGRVAGRRGVGGEITVRVASGEGPRWVQLHRILLDGDPFEIEHARAYGDRLVLKLRGVDGAGAAAALRGRRAAVPAEEVPILPEGRYWVSRLVGARVADETRGDLGIVEDVVETGGTDLLLVRETATGRERLVPLAREFVVEIDE
ncbi:MAG TPA: ribosome maturation factor RimM, partial [Candidatus Methylomirabilis sp.]|nr:ribosome maturation factor RimM [Candidatus Methylomirabilis sp.]